MTDKPNELGPKLSESKPRPPYVFLSHDTRDADIAEAFSRLLSSVTAGVLKCFRSSDKKGGQGIEYGVEWFPELMKKLQEASDVVCLLTDNSINRPWILFEAGVAKGKLDTPILGLAVGVELAVANTGPFAQFQNSADDEDSLVKLVTQLVRKIPGAEPDEAIVRQQVQSFKARTAELLKKKSEKQKEPKKNPDEPASVAKLFEEVKVMFNDLPARLEAKSSPVRRRRSRLLSAEALHELVYLETRLGPMAVFLVCLSLFRDDFPWIYDFGRDLLAVARRGNESEVKEMTSQFHELVEATLNSNSMREIHADRVDLMQFHDLAAMLHRMAEELPRCLWTAKKAK